MKILLYSILLLLILGVFMLYSVSGGSFYPWALKQIYRILISFIACFIGYKISPRFWLNYAWVFYTVFLLFLVAVVILGKISMGAQRWLSFGVFYVQPSEFMKIAIIFALCSYFSRKTVKEIQCNFHLILPLFAILLPVSLVLIQPDLGTAVILLLVSFSIIFVAGVQIWKFVAAFFCLIVSIPVIWHLLHQYQRDRIMMFLSPETDPNGAGYHIIQSNIALGSGGLFGKGFLNGTQCQLDFLPEKQTDFVFAALGEEFGFLGCMILITLYVIIITCNYVIMCKQKDRFAQLVVFGMNALLFYCTFINIAMVCGLLPVVGIPLPFFSYGGSFLSVVMFCQGVILSFYKRRKNNVLECI